MPSRHAGGVSSNFFCNPFEKSETWADSEFRKRVMIRFSIVSSSDRIFWRVFIRTHSCGTPNVLSFVVET